MYICIERFRYNVNIIFIYYIYSYCGYRQDFDYLQKYETLQSPGAPRNLATKILFRLFSHSPLLSLYLSLFFLSLAILRFIYHYTAFIIFLFHSMHLNIRLYQLFILYICMHMCNNVYVYVCVCVCVCVPCIIFIDCIYFTVYILYALCTSFYIIFIYLYMYT